MAVQLAERMVADREKDEVRSIIKLFYELTTYRNIHASQWEEAANLIDPDSRTTFYYGSYKFPGMKNTQFQVDTSGALALQQFCAIADSLITPKNRPWHGLETDDEYVMKQRGVRQFYDDLRNVVFKYRYRTEGNFHGQNYRIWKSLGAYGNGIMFVDELDTRWHYGRPGLRYKAVPLGECFFADNHQGIVTVLIRWFRLTARQAAEKFGEQWLPPNLWPALVQDLQTPFQFLHCVKPRSAEEYDPERLDHRGKPFSSHYVSIEGQCLVAPEGGYHTFPYAISRYDQMPGEVYGRGPAQLSLPGLKTLNAEKGIFLKTGHRASDPVLIGPDDGLVDFDMRAGAYNGGGVSSDGKPLIHTVPTGDIAITEKMMLEERGLIENMFLTPLFKTLMQNPNMTATQVVELINERAMLVAPTLGRQHSEYAGSLVPRELALLSRMRDSKGRPIIPRPPDVLLEAGYFPYEVTDTSPLAQQAKSSQMAGALRTLDIADRVAANTGDTTVYDHFAFERMIPAAAIINEMPTEWTATPQELAAKQKNRAKQQQIQENIQTMPARAAMIKAQKMPDKSAIPGMQPQQPMVPA